MSGKRRRKMRRRKIVRIITMSKRRGIFVDIGCG